MRGWVRLSHIVAWDLPPQACNHKPPSFQGATFAWETIEPLAKLSLEMII